MSLVTDVLRDKSGLDGDGDSLVTQALGFSPQRQPKIKANKLQTQTERDVQKGLMLVLQGMYALIRNPRSHETVDDDQHTADTIVLFIDYLLEYLGRSQQSFTVQWFLDRVTDAYFVQDPEYVTGIVDMIPAQKAGDTLIEVFRIRYAKQTTNHQLVIEQLVDRATDDAIEDFMSVVSEDLQTVDDAASVGLVISVLPSKLWPRIQRIPRLRAETMLLNKLESAWYETSIFADTGVAVAKIAEHYLRKGQLRSVIINMLQAEDFDQHSFVTTYFLQPGVLAKIFEGEEHVRACVSAICDCVASGNESVKDCLVEWLTTTAPREWRDEFVRNLSDVTDPDNPEIYLRNGTPLLGKFVPRPNPGGEDDIPF